jgi:hypothetical protein
MLAESVAEPVWTLWSPPYDPRRMVGTTVIEDEHGRLISTADCSLCCPGCGVCCAGYRDRVTPDYAGVEEYEPNLKTGRGGLVRLEEGSFHRRSMCGEDCPGYGRCCPPFDLRNRPESVADARRILLESDESWRWEQQEALLILAHAGTREAVNVLEIYTPQAHTRLAGFAECALDEGRMWVTVPQNEEEARQFMQQEVLRAWEDRLGRAYGEIEDLEEQMERGEYELELLHRLADKAEDEESRVVWWERIAAREDQQRRDEAQLAHWRAEWDLCGEIMSEIEADLAAAGWSRSGPPGADDLMPF